MCRDLDVAEQQLNRPQVRAHFEQVRGVGMAQEMRRARACAARRAGPRRRQASQRTFGRDGLVGAPAVDGAGKQPRLRPHPAVVHAQRREQRRAERHVAIASALPVLNVNQHAPAVDVARPADAAAPRSACRSSTGPSASCGATDCRAASISRATSSTLRICGSRRGTFGIRRVVEQVPTLQRLHEEEAERRDVELDRPRRHLPLAQQIRLIRPEVGLIQSVGRHLKYRANCSTAWR